MTLLEVIALGVADAVAAESGGADRIELVGTMADDGLSAPPALVEAVCRAVTIPVRPMVRLRGGFVADAAELARLRRLVDAYVGAGAAGIVAGFLDASGGLDAVALRAVVDAGVPWTCHRAIDHATDADAAWGVLRGLPGLDQVLTAGSPDGVRVGLESLVRRARSDPDAARLVMAGGGLAPEHVAPLAAAGVRAFHVGSGVRPGRSFEAVIDAGLVATWRGLVDGAASGSSGAAVADRAPTRILGP